MTTATLEPANPIGALLGSIRTSDGMFCVDSDQRIVYWSDNARALLGHDAREVLGRPCHEVLGGRDAENRRFCRRECPVVANARRGRPTPDYDVLARRKDGSDVWVNVSVMVLRGERARRPYVLHLVRDVTERRRVEQLARRAMDALRELSSAGAGGEGGPADARPVPAPALPRRETQVLRLLALGLTTEQIAANLGISPITARNHVTHVVSKLGAKTRLQAVLYASSWRLI
jgi:PAS domain S-box-containing protein